MTRRLGNRTVHVGHSDLGVFASPLNAILWAKEILPGFGEVGPAIVWSDLKSELDNLQGSGRKSREHLKSAEAEFRNGE